MKKIILTFGKYFLLNILVLVIIVIWVRITHTETLAEHYASMAGHYKALLEHERNNQNKMEAAAIGQEDSNSNKENTLFSWICFGNIDQRCDDTYEESCRRTKEIIAERSQ